MIVNILIKRNMNRGDGTLETINELGYSIRGTLGFVALLVVVYAAQWISAAFMGYETTYRVVNEYIRSHIWLFVYGSPLVHSSFSHLIWNLGFLLIGGALTERRVGWWKFVAFVYGVGLLTNILPAILGFGGFSNGISGGNFGLWAFFGLVYTKAGRQDDEERPKLNFVLALGGTVYALIGVFQYLGLFPAPPGSAKGAHLLGIIFGVLWFFSRRFDFELHLTEIHPRE